MLVGPRRSLASVSRPPARQKSSPGQNRLRHARNFRCVANGGGIEEVGSPLAVVLVQICTKLCALELGPDMYTHTLPIADDSVLDEFASDQKPEEKARPSSPRQWSPRRRSTSPGAKRLSTTQSTSRPRSSARRTPRVAPLAFEAASAPMFAAPNNNPGSAGAMTPEMLAKSVSDAIGQIVGKAIADAVTHALAEYQRTSGVAPEPAIQANIENVAINAANDWARSTESPVVVHGNMPVLQQLRRDMGIDDFLSDPTLFQADASGIPAYVPVDADAFTQEVPVSALTPRSLDPIRSTAVSEPKPADLFPNWAEDLEWLAAELGQVRDPETAWPEWVRDPGTGVDDLSPRTLPARVGAWVAARDMRPRLASFAADTIAWLRSATLELSDPFRGGQVRVRTGVVWLIAASAVLRVIGKG